MFSTSNSSTSSILSTKFSAPVVQSRLEHHHLRQQQQKAAFKLSKSETRPTPQHQRSKSLSRGKRSQKENSTPIAPTSSSNTITILNRTSKNNYSLSSNHRVDSIVDFTEIEQSSSSSKFGKQSMPSVPSRKSNSGNGNLTTAVAKNGNPPRRHQYSDSADAITLKNNAPVVILQRPKSATDFVNAPSLRPLEEETSEKIPLEQQQRRSPNKTERFQQNRLPLSRERRQSDVPLSKAKRAQRHKEHQSMTEALQHIDPDVLLQSSSMQQESSDESDVNSNTYTYMKRVSNISPKTSPLGEHYSLARPSQANPIPPLSVMNGKFSFPVPLEATDLSLINSTIERSPSKEFKRHSDSFVPSQSVVIPNNMPRRQSSTAIELQSQLASFADPNNAPERHSAGPSSSPSRSFSNQKYAGPTFAHSSPEASQLPLPSFVVARQEPNENLSGIPEFPFVTRVSTPASSNGNRSEDENMFVMDDVESQSHDDYKRKSVDILTLLAMSFDGRAHRQQQQQEQFNQLNAYNVPAHMATSRPLHVYPTASGGDYLTEISENLRSLLKIQGQ